MKVKLFLLTVGLTTLLFACATEEKKEEKASVAAPAVSADSAVKEEPFVPHETIHRPNESKVVPPTDNPFKGSAFKAEIIHSDTLGWGYDLYIDGKKTIHQPHVPGVSGLKGFRTKEQASKAANFVLYKLKNNIMPPSVSKEELDSLGVLN